MRMRLCDLIEPCPVTLVRGDAGRLIAAVTDDSRLVEPGDLFVARTGASTSGVRFIQSAVERGAVSVLVSEDVDPDLIPATVDVLVATGESAPRHPASGDLGRLAGLLAERAAGHPSGSIRLIGVTGTNGKTTVTTLVQQFLRRGGIDCGLIGTVRVDDGRTRLLSELTTPSGPQISQSLRRMRQNGCRACAMEVSSHALDQGRTDALTFTAGVFTNISGDHLDYHGTLDAYVEAKARLFAQIPSSGFAVLNADDPGCERMAARCVCPVIRVSVVDRTADAYGRAARTTARGTSAAFVGPWGEIAVDLPLVGRFNLINALQAVVVAHRIGLHADGLTAALAHASAPAGRLEPVPDPAREIAVLVDYAHTDDALDSVLGAVRPLVPSGRRLICVFGCGGDRDRSKRPRMARAAARWSDHLVITSDNPRTESPEAIITEVLAGLPDDAQPHCDVCVDREQAIRRAILAAEPGDVVVIAGKGHEDYQIVGTEKRPFDDRLVAAEALSNRAHSAVVEA